MLPIIAMHCFSCSYPESIPHLGCGQISPILSASKRPTISISRQSLLKWVSPTYTHTQPLTITGSSRVRISWIPCLPSRKGGMAVALEATNGLQRQGEPEESLEEEELHFVEGKLLSELSTWGIGGPAKYFVELHTEPQLLAALRCCHKHNLHFLILGRGSNCLFDDRGFDGCVMLNRINFIEKINPATYRVGSGYAFNLLGLQCSKDGFTGLEFASGIPGTVGGAVFMNAGADGQETADVLKSVEVIMVDGSRRVFQRPELTFSYRKSPFQGMQHFAVIVAATFELKPLPSSREHQKDYLQRRYKTQPISDRSAGCVFRNPTTTTHSAGAVIEQAGLKGVMLGGAKVSEVHANFLINVEKSTSTDMRSLIKFVKDQVREKVGVELHEEILYVPYN